MKHLIFLLSISLCLAGCNTVPKDFSIHFVMESVNYYKLSIDIDKNRNYLIRQQNLYMDRHVDSEAINTVQGQLSEEAFAELATLIHQSRLFNMKNSYGFKNANPDDPLADLIYQISYTEGRRTKDISIRHNPNDSYSASFIALLRFLSNCISEKLGETE